MNKRRISGKRILITGAAGFIGSNLSAELSKENIVVGVDNLSLGNISRVKMLERSFKNFSFKNIDIFSNENLNDIFKEVDIVFHLAANSVVRDSFMDRTLDLNNNFFGTWKILEAMLKSSTEQIVFSSTAAVYGNPELLPTPENYGPLLPTSNYGASKLSSEAYISSYQENYGIKATVFRFANVIGKNQDKMVIHDFISKLGANSNTLEILGNGKQRRSFLYIDDCVEGLLTIGLNFGRIYNLGTKGLTSITEVADMVSKAMGVNPNYSYVPFNDDGLGWAGDVKTIHLDISKALRDGWTYTYDSNDAVKKAIDDFLNSKGY